MKLLEAIVAANHRAVAGDRQAGLNPSEWTDALPLVALTCIDPRLNPLFPGVLGLSPEDWVWLRNAGNIITGPLSSTLRSLALACAIKGGREIAIIGHTDCKVRGTTMLELSRRLEQLGIDRSRLPENLQDYFGLFASERQNVIKGVDFVRQSPLIGPRIPVHGLLVDLQLGQLEWLVNGYATLERPQAPLPAPQSVPGSPMRPALPLAELGAAGARIGEGVLSAAQWLSELQAREPLSANAPLTPQMQSWLTEAQVPGLPPATKPTSPPALAAPPKLPLPMPPPRPVFKLLRRKR